MVSHSSTSNIKSSTFRKEIQEGKDNKTKKQKQMRVFVCMCYAEQNFYWYCAMLQFEAYLQVDMLWA